MSIKLHRCGITWFKLDAHPCWKVEKALQERGVDYEVVFEPTFPRGKRKDVKKAYVCLKPGQEINFEAEAK